MTELIWEDEPDLRRPLVLVALEGMFDAGEASTNALDALVEQLGARPLATIGSEDHFDFQQQRPLVTFDDQGRRVIQWPDTHVYSAPAPERPHDLVLVRGVEPHLAWRSWVARLMEVVRAVGSEMVVTLGATPAGVPHTRPPRVTGSSADAELATTLGLSRPTYTGPTGVIGALHEALDRSRYRAISLRVAVPHYLGGSPNPRATRALLEHVERVTGVATGLAALDDEVTEWMERVAAAVVLDDDVTEYVSQLEQAYDRELDQIASSVDLAAELERFLQDHPRDHDADED